jgi:metal-sulfur cluster biosynthetic enzyme
MERCGSLICSDRLTIYANVCGFRYKLNSTILNDIRYSYSTCMLALIMPNEVKDKFTVNLPKIDMSKVNLERNVEWNLRAMAFRRQALK